MCVPFEPIRNVSKNVLLERTFLTILLSEFFYIWILLGDLRWRFYKTTKFKAIVTLGSNFAFFISNFLLTKHYSLPTCHSLFLEKRQNEGNLSLVGTGRFFCRRSTIGERSKIFLTMWGNQNILSTTRFKVRRAPIQANHAIDYAAECTVYITVAWISFNSVL